MRLLHNPMSRLSALSNLPCSSPDAVRGTAQPEVTPAGHRVQGPGYGQKPRTRGCDAAKQLTQGHLRASWRQLRLRCRQLRLSQSPVRSLRLRGKRPVLLMSSLAVCCGSGVHSPHDAAAWWAPAEGSEMARSPFRESTRGQGSIQHATTGNCASGEHCARAAGQRGRVAAGYMGVVSGLSESGLL